MIDCLQEARVVFIAEPQQHKADEELQTIISDIRSSIRFVGYPTAALTFAVKMCLISY